MNFLSPAFLIALPLLIRDRRLWFGAAMLFLFFVPLLFLPGRLYAAYCYLPLAGLAIMAATIAAMPSSICSPARRRELSPTSSWCSTTMKGSTCSGPS